MTVRERGRTEATPASALLAEAALGDTTVHGRSDRTC